MSVQTMRALRRAILAALVATFASLVQAAFYDSDFDPEFDGFVRFQIGDDCLLNEDGIYSSSGACTLNLVSANVFPLPPNTATHYISGFQGDVGFQVVIAGHDLTAFSTSDPPLSCGVECSGDIEYFISGQTATLTGDTFDGTLTNAYRLVRVVPEPGTLGLLLGGIAAVWLARRRRNSAV